MIRIPVFSKMEMVKRTMDMLPSGMRQRLGEVDFWVDVDPIYGGVHGTTVMCDGRLYRYTSHCVYASISFDKRTTVVLLDGDCEREGVILHELGHVLDDRIRFNRPAFTPLGDYAATSGAEAFATAFQSYFTLQGETDWGFYTRDDVMERCPEAAAFFDMLCADSTERGWR